MAKKKISKNKRPESNPYYFISGLFAVALLIFMCTSAIKAGFPESIAEDMGSFTLAAWFTYIPLILLSYVTSILLLFTKINDKLWLAIAILIGTFLSIWSIWTVYIGLY